MGYLYLSNSNSTFFLGSASRKSLLYPSSALTPLEMARRECVNGMIGSVSVSNEWIGWVVWDGMFGLG